MPTPPPELSWVAIIGGILGISLTILRLRDYWLNRRRIEFRVVSAYQYYETWSSSDVARNAETSPGPAYKPDIEEGDVHKVFTVLEFAVKNHYERDMIIGRFVVNGWIFSGDYTNPGPSAYKRDYRVFDLFSKEVVNLGDYEQLSPEGTVGFRIEILEESYGPEWVTHKYWTKLDPVNTFRVEFQTDAGRLNSKVKVPPDNTQKVSKLSNIYIWSDLIERDTYSPSITFPQTISRSTLQNSYLPSPWTGSGKNGWWVRVQRVPKQVGKALGELKEYVQGLR